MMNDVQATGEASSPQKGTQHFRTIQFSFWWAIFDHLDPDPDLADQIQWLDLALVGNTHPRRT
jgi:hypothetical protein